MTRRNSAANRVPDPNDPVPEAPAGLRGYAIEVDDQEFAVLEWSDAPLELPARLTAAEREVVRRMLLGASNADMARARGTSVRTIANQVASALRKLGIGSRLELYSLFAAAGVQTRAGAAVLTGGNRR
jgi:DNA-binding CsgD family transcriptional regulator